MKTDKSLFDKYTAVDSQVLKAQAKQLKRTKLNGFEI